MGEGAGGGRLVRDLRLPLAASDRALKEQAARALGLDVEEVAELRVEKRSIDARGSAPVRVLTVRLWTRDEEVPAHELPHPSLPPGLRPLTPGQAPIIVGTGPAGLWAALRLVEAGQPVVLLERGGAVEERNRAVRDLRSGLTLDPDSNLCFGEGGAGTYSDGKLYTRVKDPRVRRVYRDLVSFGSQPEILMDAHPHVGTNRLIKVLGNLRRYLLEAGCEVRFGARVDGLVRDAAGCVQGVRLADGSEIEGPQVILATGHSARDTYVWLHSLGVRFEPKAFAIGARVEHPQALIDQIQYGEHAGHEELGAARYAVSARIGSRGVYSFCMCPGGFVIPTPAAPEHLNVNGMSNSNRGSRWANSALVVTVEPEDFWLERPGDLDAHGPLAGVALQAHLEQLAYGAGGGSYTAPAQRITDFLASREGDVPASTSYRPGIAPADLRALLPQRIIDPLSRAVHRFEQRLPGFLTEEAVLIGVETTTSSPLRMPRSEADLTAPGFPGLYPCGEGAGYSGGIVSSAIEGLRVAEAILGA